MLNIIFSVHYFTHIYFSALRHARNTIQQDVDYNNSTGFSGNESLLLHNDTLRTLDCARGLRVNITVKSTSKCHYSQLSQKARSTSGACAGTGLDTTGRCVSDFYNVNIFEFALTMLSLDIVAKIFKV